MARSGITFDDVSAAAEALVANGENPTIQKIRDKLGTGSPNTIHRHLTQWRDAAPVAERKAPSLPATLQTAIVQEIEKQAAEAKAKAEADYLQAKEEAAVLSETGERLEAESAELNKENEKINDECKRLETLADERSKEIESLKIELEQQRETNEKTRLELAHSLNKSESQTVSISDLKAEIKGLKGLLEKSVEDTNTAEKKSAVAQVKQESAVEQSNSIKKDLEATKKELEGQRKQVANIQVQVSEKEAIASKAREEAAELRGKLAAKDEQIAQLKPKKE